MVSILNKLSSLVLEGLVKVMREKQQLSFKQAVVRQTIYYVSKQLPREEQDNGERYFISLANKWIEQPTQENAQKASMGVACDYIDGGMRYFDYPSYFLTPAEAAGSSAYDATQCALTASGNDSRAAYEWQITAAWAILNNKEPPRLK
ncbi:hypothetical protein QUA27_20715 [Microcoleus sp. Pol14C6]|uniref:hypothetical protein n=1 Tax=unclassified Microcoleus TaxID=2642155 RepID=UPI002FD1AB6F